MPTIEQGRQRARDDRLQAHWIIPGEAAIVYNVVNHTEYIVKRLHLGSDIWTCGCPWYLHGGPGFCKHQVAVMDKVNREHR